MDVELAHEPRPVRLRCFYADSQLHRNIFGGLSFADQLKDLALARGEGVRRYIGFRQISVHDRARYAGAQIN